MSNNTQNQTDKSKLDSYLPNVLLKPEDQSYK